MSEDCNATSKWQGQVWGLNQLFHVTEFYLHLPWALLELYSSLQSEVGTLEEQIVHHLSILIQISLVQLAAQSRAAWLPKMSIPSSRTQTCRRHYRHKYTEFHSNLVFDVTYNHTIICNCGSHSRSYLTVNSRLKSRFPSMLLS